MKKAIVLFVISFCCISTFSQLLNKNNQWNLLNIMIPTCGPLERCSGIFYQVNHYKIGNDTIIHNKVYSTVLRSQNQLMDATDYQLYGFIREAENHKKVYTILTNYSDSTEVLLYDFTMKKDSIFTSTFQYTSYLYHKEYTVTNTFFSSKVIDVDTIEYAGVKRLRIKFEAMEYMTGNKQENISWIEGIGSPQNLLRYDISNSIFLCFKQNGEVMYTENNGYDCNYVIPPYVDVINLAKPAISIYPNPSTNGNFTIKNNDESSLLKCITIYSIQGIKLKEYFPNTSYFKLENLKPGVYMLDVDNAFTKLVVQ